MPDTLFALIRNIDEPIALPAFRIGLIFDGMLDQPDVRYAALTILDLFDRRFGGDLQFMARFRPNSAAQTLAKFSGKKLQDWRVDVEQGMPKYRGFRLYGGDQNPLHTPFMPYFSLSHMPYPMTRLEMALPDQADGLREFSDDVDAAVRQAPVRFGYQGYGFARSPVEGLMDNYLPPAFNRYRTALMGDVLGQLEPIFYSKPFVTMRRADQIRSKSAGQPYDYTPGITDIGWRTYIGREFADRLDHDKRPAEPSLHIDRNDRMTVVTAGDQPIWGDLNTAEDIAPWQAAHRFLKPAFASQNILKAFTLAASAHDPATIERRDGYLRRLNG